MGSFLHQSNLLCVSFVPASMVQRVLCALRMLPKHAVRFLRGITLLHLRGFLGYPKPSASLIFPSFYVNKRTDFFKVSEATCAPDWLRHLQACLVYSDMQGGKLETKAGIWAGISLPRCVTHPAAPETFSLLLLKNWEVSLADPLVFQSFACDQQERLRLPHAPRTGSKGFPGQRPLHPPPAGREGKARFPVSPPFDGVCFWGPRRASVSWCRSAAGGCISSPGSPREPAAAELGERGSGEMLRHSGQLAPSLPAAPAKTGCLLRIRTSVSSISSLSSAPPSAFPQKLPEAALAAVTQRVIALAGEREREHLSCSPSPKLV